MRPQRRFDKSEIPMALQAEQSLLGTVLCDASGTDRADQMLRLMDRREDLFDPRHQDIFEVIRLLREAGRSADLVSVRQRLEDDGALDRVGGDGYLAELSMSTALFDVRPHIDTIREKARLRALMTLGQDLVRRVTEGEEAPEVIDAAYAGIGAISERGISITESWFGDIVPAVTALVERWHTDHERTGVATGFSKLDDITAGLQPGDLIVIAARPGIGKSALGMDIMANAAMAGKVCGAFSAEMTKEQLVLRAVCSRARVDSQRLRRGLATPIERREFASAGQSMRGLKILIDDTPMERVSSVRAKARLWKRKFGLDLLVVDYLQLLTPPKDSGKRHVDVGAISAILKATAKELKIPVLALCQLNRKSEERQGEPRLMDLRESGNIEQDADLIGLMWRPSDFGKEEDERVTYLDVEKHRSGPTGRIVLWWLKELTHFTDPPSDWKPHSGGGSDHDRKNRQHDSGHSAAPSAGAGEDPGIILEPEDDELL